MLKAILVWIRSLWLGPISLAECTSQSDRESGPISVDSAKILGGKGQFFARKAAFFAALAQILQPDALHY
jgi:hypothetical protein